MKKVLSLILAAVLLTALAVPAFAAQPRWVNVSKISSRFDVSTRIDIIHKQLGTQ